MESERKAHDKISVNKIEQRGSEEVQIVFKESIGFPGRNESHLCCLLESEGYEVEPEGNIPFPCLRVSKQGAEVEREEIVRILRNDPQVNLSGFDNPPRTPS